MTRILIAGATGLVGRHALAMLLADARVAKVVAPTRRPLESHPKLLDPIIDFDLLDAGEAFWAVDGVICALGTTRAKAGSAEAFRAVDLELPLALARLTRSRGATRFALTSSMGANARSRLLYPRTKGELEQALAALGFDSLTIVRPSLIGGDRGERRRGESLALRVFRLAEPLLPRKLRISAPEAIAASLVEAAVAGSDGRHVVEADALTG